MTLREKQRLHRIIAANASTYREARRALVLSVLRGTADLQAIDKARWDLSVASVFIAEATATLEDHGEER